MHFVNLRVCMALTKINIFPIEVPAEDQTSNDHIEHLSNIHLHFFLNHCVKQNYS